MSDVPLKRCSRGEYCVHPMGCWQPSTPEYFHRNKAQVDGYSGICRACRSVIRRAEYAANPEKFQAEKRASYLKHKDEINRRKREKYAASPEIREKYHNWGRKWRQANPDRARAIFVRHYERDRDTYIRRAKQHYLDHREQHLVRAREYNKAYMMTDRGQATRRASNNNRRIRKLNASGSFTAADIEAQRKAQTDKKGRLRCWWCGQPIKDNHYHVDHRIPLAQGGSNAPENLCLACPSCNLSKGSKMPWEWKDRLL